MNRLLKLTALIEAATGLALIAVPSVVVRLLLGGEVSGPGIPLGRVAGFAMLSLGVACWPARTSASPGKSNSPLRAMLTYNILTTLCLLFRGTSGARIGPFLWPAVVLHGALSSLLVHSWGTARLKRSPEIACR